MLLHLGHSLHYPFFESSSISWVFITMKLFETFQTNLTRMGVSSNESLINGKLLLSYLFFGLNNIFYCVFLFHGADNFREYTDSMYMSVATMLYTIAFTIVVSTSQKIFSLIEFAQFFFFERKLASELRFGLKRQPIFFFIFRNNVRGVECWLYGNIWTNGKME